MASAQEPFKNSYEEARGLLLANVGELQISAPELQHQTFQVPTHTNEELKFDQLYLPPKSGKKERLLILISGVHGIEGHVGSALQNLLIKEDFWDLRDENLGILIVHGLNPHGFKFSRRVTENNVDLNRNFDTSPSLFQMPNEGYHTVQSLLNPTEPAANGLWDRLRFYGACAKAIVQYSMDSLRRAIMKGQYEFPAGVYFGGKTFEPQKDLIDKEWSRLAEGYQQILLVDLHTGYGQRGQLHLFADRNPEIDADYLMKIFKGRSLDFGQKKDFYVATGGLVVYGAKLFKKPTRYAGIVFEFGTLDSQKTLGSLDSLYRMVRENQLAHHGAQSPQDETEIRIRFREMFYPTDPAWRQAVVKQFRETLTLALQNQKALN